MEPLPPPPSDAELEREFRLLLETRIPEGPIRTEMMAYPKDRKWLLICQQRAQLQAPATTPKDFVAQLKQPKVKSSTISHVASSLNGEPKAWVQGFLEEGGLGILTDLLNTRVDKENKKPKDLDDITQIILGFKGIMKSHEGIEQVASAANAIEAILKAELVVSPRTRISVLGMLSVFCVLSAKTHALVLSKWKTRKELVENLQEGAMDMKTACMTFLNAAISAEGHDMEEERTLVFEDLKANGLFKAIESIHELPSISEALETQLDIFEDYYDIDMSSIVPKKTPEELFKVLRDMMRQTTVYDDFGKVLLHLQNVRRNGQIGKISWDLIDQFIQVTANALSKDGHSREEAVREVCTQLLRIFDPNGTLTVGSAGAVATGGDGSGVPPPPPGGPPGAPMIPTGGDIPPPPPPPGGGPPPPPPPPGGGPPPPPPPPGGGPPPPPPPPGGGPPPPPPPPGGGPPPPPPLGGGPPPPPGGGPPPPALPKKRKIIPGQKMRNFNWNMINVRKIKDTIWEDIDDERVRLDIPALEDSFALRAKSKVEGQEDGQSTERTKKVLIQVLDSKRSQNVSIMLSRFGQVSFDEIKKAIINLDPKVIDLENLQAMIPFMPQPEEIEALKEHVHTPLTDMGKAEAFFLTIMGIPLLTLKLKAWDFMRSFDVRFGALEESVTILETATRETRNSTKLKAILEFVLAVGNYMNGSTSRGECFGFKIDSLNKMLDVKSSVDPKVTLMHFVQTQVETKFPQHADLISDFTQLETAPRQNVPTLQADIGRLKGELNLVVNLQKNPGLEEGKMKQELQRFVPEAESSVEKLQTRMETVVAKIKDLLAYFGEDPKTEPDEFFRQVASFVLAFDKAKKDTIRRKALEEKTALAEAKKLKAAEERKTKRAGGGSDVAPNALENMLNELESGAAFSKLAAVRRKAREAGEEPPPMSTGFKLPAVTLRKVSRPDPPVSAGDGAESSNSENGQSPRAFLKPVGGAHLLAASTNAKTTPAVLNKQKAGENGTNAAQTELGGSKAKPAVPPKPTNKGSSKLPDIAEVEGETQSLMVSNAKEAALESPKSATSEDDATSARSNSEAKSNGNQSPSSPKAPRKGGSKSKKSKDEEAVAATSSSAPASKDSKSSKSKDSKSKKKDKEKEKEKKKEDKKEDKKSKKKK